jgi:hypothetical protein
MLLPFDMSGFKCDRGIIMSHIETANGALIVISTQYLLSEQGIALFTNLQEIKSQLVGDFF